MKTNAFRVDWRIFFPAVILVIFGLTILLSINFALFRSQAVIFCIALVAFFFFSQVDYTIFKELRKHIYFLSLFILLLVLLIGYESNGAVRWIGIFGVGLQFSEVLKPFLALSLASYLTQKDRLSKRGFIICLLLILPVFLLIAIQPDLGNALIYVFVVLLTLGIFGIPITWFILASLPVLLFLPILLSRLHDYQRQRILTFFNPTADPLGTSYNIIQAMIAVGSGKFLGKGLGEGTQSALRFLPENHTDFMFATLAERLGFIGGTVILLVFLYLLFSIFTVFRSSKDAFGKLFVASAFSLLLIHSFVNIGMNVGLLPIVGVTLPFVSFGGSSLLSNFILLGIISSISVASRSNDVLRIK